MLKDTVSAASNRHSEGLTPEASVLLHAVERIDPNYPGVPELREQIGPDKDQLIERGWMGINRRMRVRERRGVLTRLILYVPDRAFDALDLLTVDVHVGIGALIDAHVTRAVQGMAGLRGIFGVGLHDQRSIGTLTEIEIGVSALSFGTQSVSGASLGVPAGIITGTDARVGMHRPNNSLYQTYRDYWAVGVSATVGVVGFSVGFHPIQIFDFIGGIFLVDFARDDLATTRKLRFASYDRQLLKSLNKVQRAGAWEGTATEEAEASQ